MLPFLCFCLPCVIRVLARVFGGQDAFAGKGASKDLIESLPVKSYYAGLIPSDEGEEPQCSICLSAYEEGEEVRLLPCDGAHHFHSECISSWLTVNASCPICRYDFIKGGTASASDQQGVQVDEEHEEQDQGASQANDVVISIERRSTDDRTTSSLRVQ
jgi:hypothetical protein